MQNIKDFMSDDHRHCDDYFAAVEQAVADGAWDRAASSFALFRDAILKHFTVEETLLFPAFEERSGMTMGPTQVMRGEHTQMRELIDAAGQALADKDADDYSGEAETLLIMMQQHNMKEEGILYPMCDQHLSDQLGTLMPRLQSEISEAGQGK